MKIKTIKKVLKEKFDDFCKSITDEKVRKLVQQNTIITGGAIASMLLQEKVNDFDLYFTDKETTLAVARYYVKKFKDDPEVSKTYDISVLDHNTESKDTGRVQLKVSSLGVAKTDDVDKATEYSDPESELAKELTGIDLTDGTEKAAEDDDTKRYRPVYLSDNAITLSHKVQLIIRFYGQPEEIHENYDFVHAMNYWRSDTSELHTKKEALEALLSRTLVYNGSRYPVASVLRAKKFLQRGWNINAGQYLKMLFQVSELDLKNIEVLREQLVGMDLMYMQAAIHAIEADKAKNPDRIIDSTYFAKIIDRVFG